MRLKCLFFQLLTVSTSIFAQSKAEWIHFDWHGETVFGKYYPKFAMSIPLKIENLPYHFCAQLDLGATSTMIYENSFKPFSQNYPRVIQKLDTTLNPYYLNGRKSYYLKNLTFKLDEKIYNNRNVALIPNFGDEIPLDSINTKTQKLVGTIAPDLFQGKILVIDFAHNRLTTFDQLPKKYSKVNFVNINIRKGRIKIPLQFGDSTHYVMFDTGSCIGDLLLDKETINKFADQNEAPKEYIIGSNWGESITFYTKKINQSIALSGRKLNIKTVLYSNLDSEVQFNQEEKIIGLIGPVLFSDNVVIIDYKKNKFGIL